MHNLSMNQIILRRHEDETISEEDISVSGGGERMWGDFGRFLKSKEENLLVSIIRVETYILYLISTKNEKYWPRLTQTLFQSNNFFLRDKT